MDQETIDNTLKSVSFGNVDALREALGSGMDVNATNSSGWTALQYAVLNGKPELLSTLLDAGADASLLTPYDKTTSLGMAIWSWRR